MQPHLSYTDLFVRGVFLRACLSDRTPLRGPWQLGGPTSFLSTHLKPEATSATIKRGQKWAGWRMWDSVKSSDFRLWSFEYTSQQQQKNPHTFIHVLLDQTSRPDGLELIKSSENMTPHESGYTRVPGVYFWNQLWKTSNSLYANASTLQLSFFRTHCTKVQTELWVLPQIRLKVQRFLGRGESHVVSVTSLLTHADRHRRSCSWTEAASVCSLNELSRLCCISVCAWWCHSRDWCRDLPPQVVILALGRPQHNIWMLWALRFLLQCWTCQESEPETFRGPAPHT